MLQAVRGISLARLKARLCQSNTHENLAGRIRHKSESPRHFSCAIGSAFELLSRFPPLWEHECLKALRHRRCYPVLKLGLCFVGKDVIFFVHISSCRLCSFQQRQNESEPTRLHQKIKLLRKDLVRVDGLIPKNGNP